MQRHRHPSWIALLSTQVCSTELAAQAKEGGGGRGGGGFRVKNGGVNAVN